MSVPTKGKLYGPILEILAAAEERLSNRRLAELVSDRFNLTKEDRQERIPSGKTRIGNKISWAIF